jgi:hypothetical protein
MYFDIRNIKIIIVVNKIKIIVSISKVLNSNLILFKTIAGKEVIGKYIKKFDIKELLKFTKSSIKIKGSNNKIVIVLNTIFVSLSLLDNKEATNKKIIKNNISKQNTIIIHNELILEINILSINREIENQTVN